MAKQIVEKRDFFRKYQYTKPYKERDRTKDIGIDKPVKKSNRLKFPQKPQYYTLHTVKKLTKDDHFFNIRNRDREKAQKQYRQKLERQSAQKAQVNTDTPQFQQRSDTNRQYSNLYQTNTMNTPSSHFQTHSFTYDSSLGIITMSQNSKPSSSPFNRGYAVTSGPKVYKASNAGSSFDYNSGGNMTPVASNMQPSDQSVMSAMSLNNFSQIYSGSSSSNRPSV